MELKDFQKETLVKLDEFLRAARAGTLAGAFEQVTKDDKSELFRLYRPLTDAMADAPFVCLRLRLPTGGGKTILATHAIKTVGIYLLYNGILGDESANGGNVLTRQILAKLPEFDGPKVIYCAGCLVSRDRLQAAHITVRQTPYEIKVS